MEKQYRYLIKGKVFWSKYKMPDIKLYKDLVYESWRTSLIKLECSEVELDKIKAHLGGMYFESFNITPIDITSITTVKCETMFLSNPPKPVYKVYFKEVESESNNVIIDKYQVKNSDFVGHLKKQIDKFIRESKVLDEAKKRELIKELGSNWNDNRFDFYSFIDDATLYSYDKWRNNNQQLLDFWKEIALNNSKINNEPYKVADEAVLQLKKQFNLN